MEQGGEQSSDRVGVWRRIDIGSGSGNHQRVVTRCSQWALVLTLSLSLGAHWALLQPVAWVGMVITYSRDASLAEAVSKTFDGQHPCALCKVIQEGRQDSRQPNQQQDSDALKFDFGLVASVETFVIAEVFPPIPAAAPTLNSRSDEPPKPRPRSHAFRHSI